MNVPDFVLSEVPSTEQFARARQLDVNQMDYTLQFRSPDGKSITLRNPREDKGGSLTDKQQQVTAGSTLLAFGTACWNFRDKQSTTIGIDIDTNDNHRTGLTGDQFEAALEAVCRVPWLEVRRSSGGKGLHVFAEFAEPVTTKTRKDCSQLGHAVLTVASKIADFDLHSAKDCAGSNLWLYKLGSPSNAYDVIKAATETLDPKHLPVGWEKSKVTSRSKAKASGQKVEFAPSTVELLPEHLEIQEHLASHPAASNFVEELGCWHVHTRALLDMHLQHGYRGYFSTESEGSDLASPNGYMFPLAEGGFLIKRFGNAKEDSSWYDSPNGPYAFLNVNVPFEKALQQFATNSTTRGFAFTHTNLVTMIKAIGMQLQVPEAFTERTLFVKAAKTDVRITVDKHDSDGQMHGWTISGSTWQRSFVAPAAATALADANQLRVSNIVRAISTEVESSGWCIRDDNGWVGTTGSEISNVLAGYGVPVKATMGRIRQEPYQLVYEPFKPEYLAGRRWNREAPQLACEPAAVASATPTWDAIFEHIGSGLDDDILADDLCIRRGIETGAQYLKLWVRLLIEKPEQRTPYLFLTSPQSITGKSSFGASLHHVICPGVAEINEEALVGKFTSELEGKVLCLIEELDLRDSRNKAYATLKRVLTSKTLTIRKMRTDAYTIPNYTHFIHTANDARFVPCESEDTRIVMIPVSPITQLIESIDFDDRLKAEAPSMLRKLLDLPLPDPCGRFWLPVVQTSLKECVVSNVYDNESTEVQDSVKEFCKSCLSHDPKGYAHQKEVLSLYSDYCQANQLPKAPKVAFMGMMRTAMRDVVGKRQIRIKGARLWVYTGISVKQRTPPNAAGKHLLGNSQLVAANSKDNVSSYALSC